MNSNRDKKNGPSSVGGAVLVGAAVALGGLAAYMFSKQSEKEKATGEDDGGDNQIGNGQQVEGATPGGQENWVDTKEYYAGKLNRDVQNPSNQDTDDMTASYNPQDFIKEDEEEKQPDDDMSQ